MADVSDEQAWWSNLLGEQCDTARDVPDGLWEAAVEVALDPEAAWPAQELAPTDDLQTVAAELGFDDSGHDGLGGSPGHDQADQNGTFDGTEDISPDHDVTAYDTDEHEAHDPAAGHGSDFEELTTAEGGEDFDDF